MRIKQLQTAIQENYTWYKNLTKYDKLNPRIFSTQKKTIEDLIAIYFIYKIIDPAYDNQKIFRYAWKAHALKMLGNKFSSLIDTPESIALLLLKQIGLTTTRRDNNDQIPYTKGISINKTCIQEYNKCMRIESEDENFKLDLIDLNDLTYIDLDPSNFKSLFRIYKVEDDIYFFIHKDYLDLPPSKQEPWIADSLEAANRLYILINKDNEDNPKNLTHLTATMTDVLKPQGINLYITKLIYDHREWLENNYAQNEEFIKQSAIYKQLISVCEETKLMKAIKFYSLHQSPELMSQYLKSNYVYPVDDISDIQFV